jgi:hypothetical protein
MKFRLVRTSDGYDRGKEYIELNTMEDLKAFAEDKQVAGNELVFEFCKKDPYYGVDAVYPVIEIYDDYRE